MKLTPRTVRASDWRALRRGCLVTAIVACMSANFLVSRAPAQSAVSLMTPREAWSFDNGSEFPAPAAASASSSAVVAAVGVV